MNNPVEFRKALTAKIIALLQEGTAPWVRPWDASMTSLGLPFNALTGHPYHGGNSLWLQCHGYPDPRWCTYRQARERGWQVRRGEKSATVEYWQWDKEEKDAAGSTVRVPLERPRVFHAAVFNVAQMDNVPIWEPEGHAWPPEEAAERILRHSGARIMHDQTGRAFYSSKHDEIHLPPRYCFPEPTRYYATALHELGHWSGHGSRLNRDLSGSFGSAGYAREELRAELASYFLSARIGIPHDPGQHAAYIQSWIQVLREDHNEIFHAAKDAERITEFVLEFQRERTRDQVLEDETRRIAAEERGRAALRAIRQHLEEVQEC